MLKTYLFTSESVSKGHPDKVADQISDAVLDEFLRKDRNSHVACETFITDGIVIVGGEARSTAYVDVQDVVRQTIEKIGYSPKYCFDPENCGVISLIHSQSPDIAVGVDATETKAQGAGDQGIMFGYAVNETPTYMPATIFFANELLRTLDALKEKGEIIGLGPDAKSQVTMEYDTEVNRPVSVKTILISTQHTEEKSIEEIRSDIQDKVIPEVIKKYPQQAYLFRDFELLVNPTGKFVIGGPKGDTGLTGRKIIVDTYGGRGAHGGGAFSGKDPSKVDRSAAYMARYLAKNIVAADNCEECLVQLSYAIGVAQPLSVFVRTDAGARYDEKVTKKILNNIDLTPSGIIETLGLKNPIYFPTASYGHFGRIPHEGFFSWERININKLF